VVRSVEVARRWQEAQSSWQPEWVTLRQPAQPEPVTVADVGARHQFAKSIVKKLGYTLLLEGYAVDVVLEVGPESDDFICLKCRSSIFLSHFVFVSMPVPGAWMKRTGFPARPRGARPGTVKVFTVAIVFITDDGHRHCGVDAVEVKERTFFAAWG
jgi:hypothetical protein